MAVLQTAACEEQTASTYEVLVRVESDPGKPLAGARLSTHGVPLGQSGADGVVTLSLAGSPGDTVTIDTSCPDEYRAPKDPLQVVLRPIAEHKRPEFRVGCQPLRRSMVLTVRAQNGADLPVRYLGKEIARTDDAGAAHALLDVVPGDMVTVTLDTSAPEHVQLMPQNPELKTVVPERDDIMIFDQTFHAPKPPPKRKTVRSEPTGPQKIVGVGRR